MDFARIRELVRRHEHSDRRAVRMGVGFARRVYRCASAPFRFALSGEYRAVVLLRLFRREELHQSTVVTQMDRYPEIFSVCRDHFGANAPIRILSYGCATGEEVVTLRRYFPAAAIVGAEINRHALAAARRRRVDERITFVEADAAEISRLGPFDAIFCMAVLQRTPKRIQAAGVQDLKKIYPFERFDAKVSELDRWLKKDGLLVVHHAQYALGDAAAGAKYAALDSARGILDSGPKFDRQSRRREGATNSVFVKTRE